MCYTEKKGVPFPNDKVKYGFMEKLRRIHTPRAMEGKFDSRSGKLQEWKVVYMTKENICNNTAAFKIFTKELGDVTVKENA